MSETKNQFQDFCSELGAQVGSMDAVVALESLDPQNRKVVGSVYENVIAFLADSNMVPQGRLDSRLDNAVESLVDEFSIRDVDPSQIISLVEKCGVHPAYFNQCCEEIALAINNTGANGYAYADHFHPSNDYNEQSFGANLEMMFAGQTSLYDNAEQVSSSLESFGKDVNGSISDVKLAATIAILRYHHSAIQRCLPVIPSTSNMVMYKVDYNEVYDLDRSRDSDGKVRQGAHRVPFVELYDDPSPANTEPKQIIPLLANDTNSSLVADGVIRMGKEVNLFDLAREGNKIGSSTDYTDLVGDGVQIMKAYFLVSDGITDELISMNVSGEASSRLIMSANNMDSGDRSASMRFHAPMTKATPMTDTTASTHLGALGDDTVVDLDISLNCQINLKDSICTPIGQVISKAIAMVDGSDAPAGDVTHFGTLSFDLVGIELDAKYSEENLRKTTKALRVMNKTQSHVIKGSTNAVVQFSISESAPESVVDGLSRLLTVGNDDRGIKLLLANIEGVAASLAREAQIATPLGQRVADNYVAGHRVRPYIHVDKVVIDLATINNEKASELQSDIRSWIEKYMLELITRIHNESFFPQELGFTSKPEYTILTSGYILNTLFNVKHMHNHLDTGSVPAATSPFEYRRVLPNGTVLNFVTTTFNYMTDRMLVFPVVKEQTSSVLNFAHNRTRGTYVSKATTSMDASVRNMIVANQREIPIVLNPIGAHITVQGISDLFDF